jgi:hypothetical protein
MPLCHKNIVDPIALDPFLEPLIHTPHHPPRHSHNQRAWGYLHALRHHRPGADYGPRADPYVIEQDGPHPHEALVLDRTPVEYGPMPHPDAAAHSTRHSLVHVDHGTVLDVGLIPMSIGALSARTTALYHTLDSRPRETSPNTTAPGAMNAVGWINVYWRGPG